MTAAQSGTQKLIAFNLAREEYGIPIHQIQEIVCVPGDITPVPGMPYFVEGIINLRGRIIPVIDLRRRFGLQQKPYTDKTRIVVVEASGQTVGLIVDSVSKVAQVAPGRTEPVPPSITTAIDANCLSGVAKLGTRLIILLDLPRMIGDLERMTVEALGKRERQEDAPLA